MYIDNPRTNIIVVIKRLLALYFLLNITIYIENRSAVTRHDWAAVYLVPGPNYSTWVTTVLAWLWLNCLHSVGY
jgi:hypothetical protein